MTERSVVNARHSVAGMFTQREAADMAGMSYRQISYLYDEAMIAPTVTTAMKGAHHVGVASSRWSPTDVWKLVLVRQVQAVLDRVGDVRASAIRRVWEINLDTVPDSACYLAVTPDEVALFTASGQKTFQPGRRDGDWCVFLPVIPAWLALHAAEAAANGSAA